MKYNLYFPNIRTLIVIRFGLNGKVLEHKRIPNKYYFITFLSYCIS